jgi:hypothetical protein
MLPLLLALAIIGILLIVIIVGQPDEFKLVRETRISVPREKMFPHVNDLRAWEAWSPWAKLDPNAKNSFEGPASGVGAAMAWSGNKKIGEGRMTITESQANELIGFRLDFVKPFKNTCAAEFAFRPEGDQTRVTWSMTGKSNFFFKVFGLFMDCDTMAGRDFEKGLASLKSVAEAAAQK